MVRVAQRGGEHSVHQTHALLNMAEFEKVELFSRQAYRAESNLGDAVEPLTCSARMYERRELPMTRFEGDAKSALGFVPQ